ncbi:hypothetical protein V2154_16705 [Ewingella sp. CoE-038-23]|uniref:hypothetical protein n=1 Tax=Ewingella docleensis TaxID=3118588 RepID=UPI00336555CE
MREEFEKWLCQEYEWGNDALNAAHFCDGKSPSDSYYMGGDFYFDGHSCSEALFWAWRGWQAKSIGIEVALPKEIITKDHGLVISKEKTMAALAYNGIKVKS